MPSVKNRDMQTAGFEPLGQMAMAPLSPANPIFIHTLFLEVRAVFFNFPQILRAIVVALSHGVCWSWMKKASDDI